MAQNTINDVLFSDPVTNNSWDTWLKGKTQENNLWNMCVLEVKSAINNIFNPEVNAAIVSKLESNEYVDSSFINVQTKGNAVILTGKVKSWFQKEEAGRVACDVKGVSKVINEIAISYY